MTDRLTQTNLYYGDKLAKYLYHHLKYLDSLVSRRLSVNWGVLNWRTLELMLHFVEEFSSWRLKHNRAANQYNTELPSAIFEGDGAEEIDPTRSIHH